MLGIIINPKSGKKAFRLQRLYLFKTLRARKMDFSFKVTKYAGHATELAREYVEKGVQDILILGGDGTVSEAVNGIMSAQGVDTSKVRVGIIPRGTGNDWGRYWGLTKNHKQSIAAYLNGKAVPIDIGRVEVVRNGITENHYFINSVGFGVDCLTCQMTQVLKYYVGSHRLLYAFALLFAVAKHKAQKMELKYQPCLADTETKAENGFTAQLFTMNIGNGPFSGGGIRQNPDADPRDGVFHAMFVEKPTFGQIMKALPHIFDGKLTELPFIHSIVSDRITLSTKKYLPFEADGIVVDACGPYMVTVLPHALQMVAPQSFTIYSFTINKSSIKVLS